MCAYLILSHRSRGAWIEISSFEKRVTGPLCRIAHAVRGLKFTSGLSASRIYPGRIAHAVLIEIGALISAYSLIV